MAYEVTERAVMRSSRGDCYTLLAQELLAQKVPSGGRGVPEKILKFDQVVGVRIRDLVLLSQVDEGG